jgi:hypothetical protein
MSLMFLLILVVVVVPSLVLIVAALVGRQLFTEPRCVGCGYDLRQTRFEDENARPCPECGADLTRPRAVRFGKRRRRPWLAVGGMVWFFVGAAVLVFGARQMVGGPGAAKYKTNAALIAGLASTADQPRDWRELERRLKAGNLSAAEVDDAIGQLTAYVKQRRATGQGDVPFPWADGFIKLAMTRGDILQDEWRKLCEVYYNLELDPIHRGVRQGQRAQFQMAFSHTWKIADTMVVYAVRSVTIDGAGVGVVRLHGDEATLLPDELSGSLREQIEGVALRPDLTPGEYEVKFIVDVGALPSGAPIVGVGGKPGQKQRWQNPLCTWTTELTSTLRITPPDESPITLITDSNLDPSGGLAIERAYTVPMRNGVRIVVAVEQGVANAAPYCFHVKARIGDNEYAARSAFGKDSNWSMNSGEQRIDINSPLPADVTSITVILEPDVTRAERHPRLHAIWGEPIVFENVPLERHDLDATQ